MKKSLIALAALAATGAFAQSSVTLYGRAEAGVDLGYKETVNGSASSFGVVAGVVGPTTTVATPSSSYKPGFRVTDGQTQGQGSSRFGMRGTEDLGGGLKANFVLEAGVNIDDGSSGNGGGNLFSRAAWVGLSGGFGEVRLGRQVLGSFGVHANGLAAGAASGLYEAGANIVQGGVRFANAIQYRSPDFGGISGTVSLRAPESNSAATSVAASLVPDTTDGTVANPKNKSGIDLSIAYANGPIYVGFGFNRQSNTTAFNNNEAGLLNNATSGDAKITDYALSASYNFGVAQPFFSYVNRKNVTSGSSVTLGVPGTNGLASLAPTANSNTQNPVFGAAGANSKSRQYTFGVKVPVGAATLIAAYGDMKTTGSGSNINNNVLISSNAVEAKTRAFQIGAQYPLSKRTMLQANYGQNKTTADTGLVNAITGPTTFNSSGTNTTSKVQSLNFGVQHLF